MKASKIYCIGPSINKEKLSFSGQAMMFQLLVDKLHSSNYNYKIINISEIDSNRTSGTFTYTRLLQYLKLFINFFLYSITTFKSVVYITISQSQIGFFRDYVFIKLSQIFNHKIICHQFGGNFKNFYESQSPFIKKLIKSTYLNVDSIIVEGEYSKYNFEFLKNDYNNIFVIPNGLPEKVTINYENKVYNITDKFIVLYLSNMIYSKGYMDVLNAINILVNRYKLNVECNFVGKFIASKDDPNGKNINDLELEFKESIIKMGLSENVKLFNSMYGDKKMNIFLMSHVFVLPSYYINEGQPVSVLEATAYGLVPILTNYRLMPQMLNMQSGFLVEKNDSQKIAEIISNLIKNPIEYSLYSKNTISHFNNNFSSEIYLNKILKLFNNYE